MLEYRSVLSEYLDIEPDKIPEAKVVPTLMSPATPEQVVLSENTEIDI